MRRILLLSAILFLLAPAATAAEKINSYDVDIVVAKDGDILVTETIDVTVEGRQIRRGIFRDLPRFYEKDGVRLPYRYKLKRIRRDGRKEPYEKSRVNNAVRWRIGDPDVYLDHGRHVYEITYEVKNQIRYFPSHDELYWNAVGQYWAFPVDRARIEVTLPEGARTTGAVAYTGRFGEQGGAYEYRRDGGAHVFETTRRLRPREGVTVAVSLEKGVIDPPSAADRRADWWALNGALVILAMAAVGISGFHYAAWRRVGVDPPRGPVFPHYEPPEGYSPAGVHHIYHRRLKGHDALIASLVNLAVNDWIEIESLEKKKTKLTRVLADKPRAIFPVEKGLLANVLSGRNPKILGGGTDVKFASAYDSFRKTVSKKFGPEYFKWNFGYIALAAGMSVGAVVLALWMAPLWTVWHWAGVAALVVVNLIFVYFLPAATEKGESIRNAIEGFRLYLEKAEKLNLNAAEVGPGDGVAPPPVLTVERYERFLPYAIALGVEKPWTKHFEKTLPKEAADYDPHWSTGRGGHRSLHGMNSALVSSMASGVSSAMPQSSGSSGSGGGGFSGGGGGGGGGGGW